MYFAKKLKIKYKIKALVTNLIIRPQNNINNKQPPSDFKVKGPFADELYTSSIVDCVGTEKPVFY